MAEEHTLNLFPSAVCRLPSAFLRSASGFLKILYPHLELTLMDYQRDCLEPDQRLRQAIRNSLYYLDEEFRQQAREIYVEVKS